MEQTKENLSSEWNNTTKERLGFSEEWKTDLIKYFEEGESKDFHTIWHDHFDFKDDMKELPLEFYLQLYFITVNWDSDSEDSRKERIDQFREFLDTKGKALSQISEFLPFYAFPYVEKPKSHPVYKQLFDPNWKSDLKKKLLILLGPKEEEIYPLPKLFSLLNPPEEVSNNLEKQFQNRLADAERRAFQFHQRFNKIQEDYQSLIGITSDLVDTLEGVLRGEHIEPDALQKICCRLVASQRTTVNKNVALGNGENGVSNTSSKFSYCDTLRQSLSIRKPQENLGSKQEWGFVELDYKKINETLNGSNQTQIWRLLQALRWRLTKTNVELREAYLTEFIGHDLFDLTSWNGENRQQHHLSMLEHCLCEVSPKVTESSARLVNALASLSRGRAYLAQNMTVVTLLTQQIFHLEGDEESSTRENLIGALQKLSLRRSMQTKMTEMGMVEWLVNLLEDTDSLSDYTLEYSVALLMNLCLRMDGKKRCAPMASRVLKVLTDLISHENTNILSYVNGALFSLLTLPELQIAAEAMDLEGILSCYMREDQQELNRQFEYIIKQMHSNDQNGEEDGLDDDEDGDDDEDDDEEDTAQMEVDIDRGDDITDNKENTLDSSVIGEILLKERFEKEKENAIPNASNRAGRSAMNSPLLPMPNKALSPQPPFGRHANHSENDSIMNNNAGLLRRPSTPSRRRNSNITPSQIPKPAGSTRQSVARKTPNRPSKVIEESHTKGRIGKAEHPVDSPQMSSQKHSPSASESKKRVVENHPEYQKAFNSRPKILRTPEHKVGQSEIQSSSSKSRPGSGKN